MQVVQGITVGGKYQVERMLARGGMGSVWVARHATLGHPLAIKFLDAHLAAAPAVVARFEREARAAANLDTPHVVQVHDYGIEDGMPFLVMELLRGEDLNTRLRQRGRLSLPEATKILSQMGRALRKAHDAGIVHRDLKPANVFLARMEDEEIVKILDFGIAKETWSRVEESTRTGEVFGSPHYMSPEQGRAEKTVDHRADVWATGVIVYRMITGRLPFPGEVLGEVLSKVLVEPFIPISDSAPDLAAGFDAFFARALAKKKEERYASIAELIDAFSALASGASTGAAPFNRPSDDSLPAVRPVAAEEPANGPLPPMSPAQTRGGPSVTEADAATQLYQRVEAPTAPLLVPPVDLQSGAGATGPSIATLTSTLGPAVREKRKSKGVWVGGGVAICAMAVAVYALWLRPSSADAPAATAPEARNATPAAIPPEPSPNAMPSSAFGSPSGTLPADPPGAPAATGSSSAMRTEPSNSPSAASSSAPASPSSAPASPSSAPASPSSAPGAPSLVATKASEAATASKGQPRPLTRTVPAATKSSPGGTSTPTTASTTTKTNPWGL